MDEATRAVPRTSGAARYPGRPGAGKAGFGLLLQDVRWLPQVERAERVGRNRRQVRTILTSC
jgi:hypothetical protein